MTVDFATLITASQRKLYAYIHSLLDNSAAAWDVLQETNVVLWQKQAEFRPGTKFDAWAFTVARFQVMAWLRDRKREPLDVMTPELCELLAGDAAAKRHSLITG
jgi:RNA polymerase sigma-70 factor (ECF subfamily)